MLMVVVVFFGEVSGRIAPGCIRLAEPSSRHNMDIWLLVVGHITQMGYVGTSALLITTCKTRSVNGSRISGRTSASGFGSQGFRVRTYKVIRSI